MNSDSATSCKNQRFFTLRIRPLSAAHLLHLSNVLSEPKLGMYVTGCPFANRAATVLVMFRFVSVPMLSTACGSCVRSNRPLSHVKKSVSDCPVRGITTTLRTLFGSSSSVQPIVTMVSDLRARAALPNSASRPVYFSLPFCFGEPTVAITATSCKRGKPLQPVQDGRYNVHFVHLWNPHIQAFNEPHFNTRIRVKARAKHIGGIRKLLFRGQPNDTGQHFINWQT